MGLGRRRRDEGRIKDVVDKTIIFYLEARLSLKMGPSMKNHLLASSLMTLIDVE